MRAFQTGGTLFCAGRGWVKRLCCAGARPERACINDNLGRRNLMTYGSRTESGSTTRQFDAPRRPPGDYSLPRNNILGCSTRDLTSVFGSLEVQAPLPAAADRRIARHQRTGRCRRDVGPLATPAPTLPRAAGRAGHLSARRRAVGAGRTSGTVPIWRARSWRRPAPGLGTLPRQWFF